MPSKTTIEKTILKVLPSRIREVENGLEAMKQCLNEAADEIELLRNQNQTLKKQVLSFVKSANRKNVVQKT